MTGIMRRCIRPTLGAVALICALSWSSLTSAQTLDGRYTGSFACSLAGPNPAFNAPMSADVAGGVFSMARQARFGPETFTGVVTATGNIAIEGIGHGEGGGPAEWRYELKGALQNGRIEASGRMYTRRDPNLRTCTLSLNRAPAPNQTDQASRKPNEPDPLAVALAENERRKKAEEEEARARQLAEAKARNDMEAKARVEAEQKLKAETDARARQLADAKARADIEAKARLDAEQKLKAEADARARQVADAKAKADFEAKARLDAEQKLKAEADASARQLAEAKAKADFEAKARLDAEQKLKAEADARARQLAEAEAKAKAEAEQKKAADEKATRDRKELEERVRLAELRAKEVEEKATRPIAAPAVSASSSASGRAAAVPQASDLVFAKSGAEQRIALVIGNSAYEHTPRLDNPQTDARAMASALLKTGFELIGGAAQLNLDKPKLERAIHEFSRRLRQGTIGMFYYAGHGFEVGGRNYLVPVDANPTSTRDIDFMLVDVELLLRQLRDADSRLNMVVLDACRNNPFGGGGVRGGGGLAEIKSRPSGTIISFATAAGEVARDGPPGQNSPYTAALVAAIQKPGLSVLDTFNDVAVSVQRTTNRAQQPWIQSTGIQGQFFFVPPADPPAAPASAAVSQTGGGMDRDALFWSSVKDSRDPAQLEAYLAQFPNGVYAPLARIWIEDSKRTAKPKP